MPAHRKHNIRTAIGDKLGITSVADEAIARVESTSRIPSAAVGQITKASNGAPILSTAPVLAGPVISPGNFLDVLAGFTGSNILERPRLEASIRLARLTDIDINMSVSYPPLATMARGQVTYDYITGLVRGLTTARSKHYLQLTLTFTASNPSNFVQGYFVGYDI